MLAATLVLALHFDKAPNLCTNKCDTDSAAILAQLLAMVYRSNHLITLLIKE